MEDRTLNALLVYVDALMREGFDAIHVSQLIPHRQLGVAKSWTQFPKLNNHQLTELMFAGWEYDQPSGWFRRKR